MEMRRPQFLLGALLASAFLPAARGAHAASSAPFAKAGVRSLPGAPRIRLLGGLDASLNGPLAPGNTRVSLQNAPSAGPGDVSLPTPETAARGRVRGPNPVRDPDTGLYGVSAEQLLVIVTTLREHYGDDLLDLAVVGSRARGTASALKGFRPVHAGSDLDLVPLIRDRSGRGPWTSVIAQELKKRLGMHVELHGVISFDGARFGDSVPFYGGGLESHLYFSAGEAVRIPIDRP